MVAHGRRWGVCVWVGGVGGWGHQIAPVIVVLSCGAIIASKRCVETPLSTFPSPSFGGSQAAMASAEDQS